MNLIFIWTGVTSYMADCWRELAAQPGVRLKVVVEKQVSGREFEAAHVLRELDAAVVEPSVMPAEKFLKGFRPDVVFAVGWHSAVVRGFLKRRDWRQVPKVCCFDLPWDGSLRRIVARWALWPVIRRYSAAYVPGRACARYARHLGFPKIERGLFSIDVGRFAAAAARVQGRPREGFVYLGRFSSEKRVELIRQAHAQYRASGGKWGLDLYGGGNFLQPDRVPDALAAHACLVLASDFDPWPLVVLESLAAGLRVIVTDRCTNHFELVGPEEGWVTPARDVSALAAAMAAAERAGNPGRGPSERVRDYDKTVWCRRTLALAKAMKEGK